MTDLSSHSSIGEVLSLLQVEYPDVTISKIRFLESQGLLNPERTPSGYRKFHDEDIERLRWILTQQRDHFLPLKVIKERLAAGDFAEGPPEGVLPFERPVEDVNGSAIVPAEHVSPSIPSIVAANTPATVGAGSSVRSAPAVSVSAASAAVVPPSGDGTVVRVSSSKSGVATGQDREPKSSGRSGKESGAKDTGAKDRARAVSSLLEGPASAPPAPVAPRGRKRHPTGHTKGDPTPVATDMDEPDQPPVTLTLEELCTQSGLTPGAVAELERFDLLTPRSMGPVEYYDDDALIVARLAAGFGRFGIEPRHLRMYKVSAEREAGLFEQLITPLLKQRRAAARDQAVEMLEELAELADDLRAVMVRVSLQEYLGQP